VSVNQVRNSNARAFFASLLNQLKLCPAAFDDDDLVSRFFDGSIEGDGHRSIAPYFDTAVGVAKAVEYSILTHPPDRHSVAMVMTYLPALSIWSAVSSNPGKVGETIDRWSYGLES
jgi:hypothetical protein